MKVYFTGLSSTLRRLRRHMGGLRLVHLPLLVPYPLDDGIRRLRELVHDERRVEALAFTSKTSVKIALRAAPEIRQFKGPIFAIGPGTREALRREGIEGVLVPERHDTPSLADLIRSQLGSRAALVLCSSSSPLIGAAGPWEVLPLYELRPDEGKAARLARLCRKERAAVVVTSARAAEAIARHAEAFRGASLFAISERVASRLRELGLEPRWAFRDGRMDLFPQALREALEALAS